MKLSRGLALLVVMSLIHLSLFVSVKRAAADYSLTVIANFDTNSGYSSKTALVQDAQGNLYGAGGAGGASNDGTVYEIAGGSHALSVVANFNYYTVGQAPNGVSMDAQGNLYGTTYQGGPNYFGTAFEIAAGSHNASIIANFNGTNGFDITGGLVSDSQGNLYGTTQGGGAGGGEVFEIAAGTHVVTPIVNFSDANGSIPVAGLVIDSKGNLYGTTQTGGSIGYGTAFEVQAGTHNLITLANFNFTNGAFPISGLTLDANGNLFGTTLRGGAYDYGTVFEISAATHSLTTVASFNGSNGLYPYGSLVVDSQGNLFGTTSSGGASNDGTVFEISSGSQAISDLAAFNGANGSTPYAGLLLDASGNLYGTTTNGGANGDGTAFELSPLAAVPEPISFVSLIGGVTSIMLYGIGSTIFRRRQSIAD